MVEPKATVQESLERIAISLESIALFLQVMMEDQTPIDESSSSSNTVMTQSGPAELK